MTVLGGTPSGMGPEIYPNPFQGLKQISRRGRASFLVRPEIYPNPFQGLKHII